MTVDTYLSTLDERIRGMEGLIASTSIQREVDTNLGIGFIKGYFIFIDGARLDFSEQLPTERGKFRFHYMDAQNKIIARWDSSPHHKEFSTFPFHKHTSKGAEEHKRMTLLDGLDEIAKALHI